MTESIAVIGPTLLQWIADASARQDMADFQAATHLGQLDYLEHRDLDLYHSLMGQLFDMMRDSPGVGSAWATIGNSLLTLSRRFGGILQSRAQFFAATAFYSGGYSAAAYLALRDTDPKQWPNDVYRACQDLLTRPRHVASERVDQLIRAVRDGDLDRIHAAVEQAQRAAEHALREDPELWVASRTYSALLEQFGTSNLRSLLPDGSSPIWSPLVHSMLDRRPPMWEFFPSQAEAIRAGLLSSQGTYSLQMPTGAGKTALTETLLFSHLTASPKNLAILLVPYRALARELRGSLIQRLSHDLNFPTRAVYGGTVPTVEEAQELDDIRAIVATPEALTGLLGAHPEVFHRISLVICDEGHLLDAPSRGVSLELLLARFRGRHPQPRMVFLSAIVPNIDEINTWLGGSEHSVVRSKFRPAMAEFAVMRPVVAVGKKTVSSVTLELQSWDGSAVSHSVAEFLTREDFEYTNRNTGRTNAHDRKTVKAQAIAAARKALPLGSVAVFAATKTGDQGVLGLANELLSQVSDGLALPDPIGFVEKPDWVRDAVDYLTRLYDEHWAGTRALAAGVVVHHGDLPQETREVLEELFAAKAVPMVFCTSTLAEGVNMPIRTLVLYSVQFSDKDGQREPMLARDIQNLVGRAGRAGATTRGLVICANQNQWPYVRPVAAGRPGEKVEGDLFRLIARLRTFLSEQGRMSSTTVSIDNDFLERQPVLFSLVDGIDATLVELLSDDVGLDEFVRQAEELVSKTFAFKRTSGDENRVLQRVFALRAARIGELSAAGQLGWVRRTGAMPRMVSPVLDDLLPSLPDPATVESVLDPALINAVLAWALDRREFIQDAKDAYRSKSAPSVDQLQKLVVPWLRGDSYGNMASVAGMTIDECLRIHTKVVAYSLVTLVEQGVALMQCQAEESGRRFSDVVSILPDCIRYGVPSRTARDLAAGGLRHRQAAVQIGQVLDEESDLTLLSVRERAANVVDADPDRWLERLGALQYRRTRRDLGLRASP